MPKITLHEKALAHLSRGLYRSPASALRELVSNAWDANAESVHIDTSAPRFTRLAIRDDGDGFTEKEFVRLMEGGIGNSEKRQSGAPQKYGRPTIGRLGIGMLGIAQICGGFTITSKTRDGEIFSAKVTLYDFIKQRLDLNDADVVEHRDKEGDEDGPDEIAIHVGDYDLVDVLDPDQFPKGTLIVSEVVHPVFVKSFADTYTRPPRTWRKFVSECSKLEVLQERGDYWRLLWELGALCPVPYIDTKAVPQKAIADDQKRLLGYRFAVFVDGIDVRKPVYLSDNRAGYSIIRIPDTSFRTYRRDVSFHGYIAVQEAKLLKPTELRGILIRLKEVGVGGYDQSLLDYRFNEGPRTRWITCEIFVTQGLEDALNIDRDSFNRFHPEFRALQNRIHEALRGSLFPEVYRKIAARTASKKKTVAAGRRRTLRAVASSLAGAENLRLTERAEAEPDAAATVRVRSGHVEVAVPEAASLPVKKANRPLASAILTIYDLAARESTPAARRKAFVEHLFALLSQW